MKERSPDEFLEVTLPALDLVFNLARRLLKDPDEADDLVQETYLKALQAWNRGAHPRNVQAWMATICLNTGRNWLRRASSRYEVPSVDRPEQATGTDIEAEALAAVQREQVHEALWKLPEEQRIAITLMDLDGFTAAEVARLTGSPRGTVLSRVHRGRKRLASLLGREAIRREP